jgi:hypothetical protein
MQTDYTAVGIGRRPFVPRGGLLGIGNRRERRLMAVANPPRQFRALGKTDDASQLMTGVTPLGRYRSTRPRPPERDTVDRSSLQRCYR